MRYEEFVAEFMPLVEYFKAELSEGALAIYYRGLRELSANELREAVDRIVLSGEFKFMPKVPEILWALSGKPDEKAELALKELLDALQNHANTSVCFKDRAIMGVVKAVGGWHNLGKLEGKEWEAFKTFEFKKRYPHWANNEDKCPLWLAGHSYEKNSFNNQPLDNEEVAFIGFSDKELDWWYKELDKKLKISQKGAKAPVQKFIPVIASIAKRLQNRQGLAHLSLISDLAGQKRVGA